jgi:hypothetical protein
MSVVSLFQHSFRNYSDDNKLYSYREFGIIIYDMTLVAAQVINFLSNYQQIL